MQQSAFVIQAGAGAGVTRTERSSEGRNRNSSFTGHTNGVALIGEKSIHRLFLNSPIEYPLALEPVYVRSKKAPRDLCVCWLFDLFIYLLVELFDG